MPFDPAKKTTLFHRAIQIIQREGFLLVFPIKDCPQPQSLWSQLYPNTPMKWDWNENADSRVIDLWHLREQLASSQQIVYGKFFRGRATLFSLDFFLNLLALFEAHNFETKNNYSKIILEALDIDSPLSTKQLKESTGLRGRLLEAVQTRALRELWQHLQIVGVGEIDDGAFPSLAHASTKLVFEQLWNQSKEIDPIDAMIHLSQYSENEWIINDLYRQQTKRS